MQPIKREVDTIVIHCADTPNGRPQTVADIDSWHLRRGWHRAGYFRINMRFNTSLTSIGYHFAIYVDGSVHTGRHPDEIGAHVAGHNSKSIGICLIGTDKFTPAQWASLKLLVADLQTTIKTGPHKLDARVMGHCQFDTAIAQGKTCPNFDVPAWVAAGMNPDPKHILTIKEA